MKLFTGILFSVFLLLNSMIYVGILFQFKINQADIVQTQCVQRISQNNLCQGSCVLQNTLEQSHEKQDKDNLFLQNILQQYLQDKESNLPVFKVSYTFMKAPINYLNVMNIKEFVIGKFKPPRL